ncbi:MAG: M48 family metalloprotease [Candidatus Fermentibacteraceae bacterium]|nr:M48 family metalloprotease [Candidatus Fermentibacteraceae bacterium]
MIPIGNILLTVLIAFGLGDIVDTIGGDDVQSALNVIESFSAANKEITEVEEYYLGRSVAATIFTMYQPLDDPVLQQYVNLIGQTVACSSPQPTLFGGYHFMVLDSDQINALACPGGLIFICRGLIDKTSSEDELAAIIAHEVSHVALNHGISSIDQARWTDFGLTVAHESAEQWGSSEVQSVVNDYGDLVDDVVSNLITRGYSRDTEYQADSLAVEICSAAGYDPEALASVLEKISEMDNRSGPGFWETHPSPEDRLEAINKVLSTLQQSDVDPVRTARFLEYISGTASLTGDEPDNTTGTRSQRSSSDDQENTGSSGSRGGSSSPGTRN